MKRAGLFIFLVMAVAIFGNANGASLDDLKKSAAAGDAMAQYKYADELAWSGLARNEALDWYEKAAKNGNAYAKLALASLQLAKFGDDSGKEKDFLEKNCPDIKPVVDELEKSKAADAAYNLWDVYENGICVKKDAKKAMAFLREAADGGNDKAQYLLAQHYLNMPKEAGKSLELLKKSFAAGLPMAGISLASCYYGGKGTEKNETEAEKVAELLEKSGNPKTLALLGYNFYRGKNDFPRDEARGKRLLERAAAGGEEQAQKLLDKIGGGKAKK